jgi:hypothetical protein
LDLQCSAALSLTGKEKEIGADVEEQKIWICNVAPLLLQPEKEKAAPAASLAPPLKLKEARGRRPQEDEAD